MLSAEAWLVLPTKRVSAKMTLFCVPHAGVGTSAFRGWAEAVDETIEVCLVQLPGREGRFREPLPSSVLDLAPELAAHLGDVERPFAFYGHSLGALLAFETARALRRILGRQPVHLFAAAAPAPQLPWEHSPLRSLPEPEFIDEIQKRYGRIPSQVLADTEIRQLLLPVLRADVGMVETYQYSSESPLDCGITVLCGDQDHMVSRGSAEAWRAQTSRDFSLLVLPGNHLFLQTQRLQLVRRIGERLLDSQAELSEQAR